MSSAKTSQKSNLVRQNKLMAQGQKNQKTVPKIPNQHKTGMKAC